MLRDLDGFIALRLSLFDNPPQFVLFAPEGEQAAVSFAVNGLQAILTIRDALNDAVEQWEQMHADIPQ